MTTTILRDAPIPSRMPFPAQHPWDPNAFLAWTLLAWAGVLAGFGPQIVHHVQSHARPYPPIVHVHAAVFVGWLALFTTQVLLIRDHQRARHRTLGYGLVVVAAAMMVLGPATALTVARQAIGTKDADPGFLSTQFTDIAAFVGLTGAAVILRNHAAAHKRLILLGTLYITDAGFSRWMFPVLKLDPMKTVPAWFGLYGGVTALILSVGAYDLVTRRRLHPAYVTGLVWVVLMQALAMGLYPLPGWTALATRIIAAV